MPDCFWFPERCIAEDEYTKEQTKFQVDRIKDAAKKKEEMKKTLKERLVKKEWKNIYPLNNYDFDYEINCTKFIMIISRLS